MLRTYKAIAERISKVWGASVSLPSVMRWSKMAKDPLPIKRIKPVTDGTRSIVTADGDAVERWARRRLP